jgi:DNA-binding transcriptional MerR regulator
MTGERLFSSTELMRAARCTRKALRVYQARGLILPVCEVGNHRYDAAALERLQLIVTLREINLSLDEIAVVLRARDAVTGGDAARAAAADVDDLIDRINKRITGLQTIKKDLETARGALDNCTPCERPPTGCGDCARDGSLENQVARTLLVHGS